MTFPPLLRKAVLATHVVTSVGWLGAVAAYLTLDVTAATSRDAEVARAAFVALEPVVLAAILPLALASLTVGVLDALGTTWGLFRHWWVVMKLLLTPTATLVLLVQVPGIRRTAELARSGADPTELPGTLGHSIGGLVVLLAVAVLSIYKPRGLTRYGWRRQQAEREGRCGQPALVRP